MTSRALDAFGALRQAPRSALAAGPQERQGEGATARDLDGGELMNDEEQGPQRLAA